MKSPKLIFLIIAITTIIAILFITMDFHLAKPVTNTSVNSIRVNSHVPKYYQPLNSTIYIAQINNDLLTRTLAEAVFLKAKASPYFSPILLASDPKEQQFPLLLVTVENNQVSWTPFYAKSNIKTKFAFSNYESLTGIPTPVELTLTDTGDQPLIQGSGNFEQTNQSFGLLSIPGYRRLICDLAAQSIIDELEKMVGID